MGRTPSPEPFEPFSVVVPNRVDIAGGTLDIFPVYVLVPGAMTVNAAIDVKSRVVVRPTRGAVRLVAENYDLRAEANDTHSFPGEGAFGLITAALRFYPPMRGIEMRFRNDAPVGSGIGASSALLVATMLAADLLLGLRRRWQGIARAAMEIEASHLRGLTGRQDYIAALRGGIQGILFLPGRLEVKRFAPGSAMGSALARHGILASTGKAHHSGRVNWRMIRGAIEGRPEVLRKFRGIAAAAHDSWAALEKGRVDGVAEAVAQEWAVRKTLAPGVAVRSVERLFSSRAFRMRVAGAKLCGAGGGGMIFGLLRDPSARSAVDALLAAEGFAPLPFRLSGGPEVTRGADVR